MQYCAIKLNATLAGEPTTLDPPAAAVSAPPFDFSFECIRTQRAELCTQEAEHVRGAAELSKEKAALMADVKAMEAAVAAADAADAAAAEARREEEAQRVEEAAARARQEAADAAAAAKAMAAQAKMERLEALRNGPQTHETIAEQLRLSDFNFTEQQITESLKRANSVAACVNWIYSQ